MQTISRSYHDQNSRPFLTLKYVEKAFVDHFQPLCHRLREISINSAVTFHEFIALGYIFHPFWLMMKSQIER